MAITIEAKPQLGAVLGAFGFNKDEKCKDVTFKGKECAKLYDDENCDGEFMNKILPKAKLCQRLLMSKFALNLIQLFYI